MQLGRAYSVLVTLCVCWIVAACGDDAGSAPSADASDGDGAVDEDGGGLEPPLDAGDRDAGDGGDLQPGDDGGDAGEDGGDPDAGAAVAPVELDRPFESGSRLVARYLSAPGLPPSFVSLVDTDTDQPCSFMPTEDGTLRCLPAVDPREWWLAGYLDEDCTEPVYEGGAGCEPPAALSTAGSECGAFEVHAIEELEASGAIYTSTGTDCVEAGATNERQRKLGASLPVSSYVAGREALVAHDGPLTRRVVVAEDGAVEPGPIVEKEYLLSCRATYTDELRPCHLETGLYYEGPSTVYTDDACTMEVELRYAYSYVPAECPQPPLVIDADVFINGGFEEYGARLRGDRITDALWSDLLGECTRIADQSWSASIYEVGEPVALPELVGVTIGDERLRGRMVADEDGTVLGYAGGNQAQESFFDSELDVECEVLRQGDRMLCIPGSLDGFRIIEENASLRAYSDSECTEAITYCGSGSCEESLFYTAGEAACGAPQLAEAWRLTGLHEGPIYGLADDVCTMTSDGSGNTSLWTRAPLSLDDLVELEEVTEAPR